MIGMAITGKIGRAVARWRWQRRVAREWRAVEGSERLRRFYELVAETAVRGNMLSGYGAGTAGGVGGDPRGALLAGQIVCAEAAEQSRRMSIAQAAQTVGGPQFYFNDPQGAEVPDSDDDGDDEDENGVANDGDLHDIR